MNNYVTKSIKISNNAKMTLLKLDLYNGREEHLEKLLEVLNEFYPKENGIKIVVKDKATPISVKIQNWLDENNLTNEDIQEMIPLAYGDHANKDNWWYKNILGNGNCLKARRLHDISSIPERIEERNKKAKEDEEKRIEEERIIAANKYYEENKEEIVKEKILKNEKLTEDECREIAMENIFEVVGHEKEHRKNSSFYCSIIFKVGDDLYSISGLEDDYDYYFYDEVAVKVRETKKEVVNYE